MEAISDMKAILASYELDSNLKLSDKQIDSVKLYLIAKRKDYDAGELLQMFNLIYVNIVNLSGNGGFRVLVNDTLSIWLLRAFQFCNSNDPKAVAISDDKIFYLFQYIVDFLEQNSTPLFNSVNSLLVKLLAFVRLSENKEALIRCFIDRTSKLSGTSKRLYYLLEVLSKEIDSRYILSHYSHLMELYMQNIGYNPLANSISKSFSTIYRGQYEVGKDEEWLDSWFSIVKNEMGNKVSKENIQLYLLPQLFKISPKSYLLFVKRLTLDLTDDSSIDQFIHILNIGKNLLIIDPLNNDLIDKVLITRFLSHKNPKFRLNSFNLLANTIKSSTPIPQDTYEIILNNNVIEIFMNDYENIEIRNEFTSSFKNFLVRIKDSVHALTRELSKLKKKKFNEVRQLEISHIISSAFSFLNHLVELFWKYLQVGSSYSQLYTSYKILEDVLDIDFDKDVVLTTEDLSEGSNMKPEIISENLINILILNTMSNYQDIKEMNSQILSKVPLNSLRSILSFREDELTRMAIDILYDLKGRNSDGGAKMIELLISYYLNIENSQEKAFDLIFKLVSLLKSCLSIKFNKNNINTKDTRAHGILTALNLSLSCLSDSNILSNINASNQINYDIINKISEIWFETKDILSNEMYDDQEESNSQKFLSSYCWRVVKESSSLISTILKINQRTCLLNQELILKCSDLIIEQLANVSHRGAFSSVYASFISICEICFSNDDLKLLPKSWLEKNIILIESKTQFISRRSGGLPFLITAILSADLKINSKSHELMGLAFEELLRIARLPYIHKMDEKNDIPQVHAFNCIKQIFADSVLSNEALVYLNSSLGLTLENFNSVNWSIRNCAVMLFTSLQQKIFGNKMIGNNYTKMAPRLFFNRYLGIDEILMKYLKDSLVSKSEVEVIFPVLTILSRVEANEEDPILKEFEALLNEYLNSEDWKIREMASQSISSIIAPDHINQYCSFLIEDSNTSSLNKIHGNALTLLEILKRMRSTKFLESSELKSHIFNASHTFLTNERNFNWSISKVYVDILWTISKDYSMSLPSTLLNVLGNFLIQNLVNNNKFFNLNGARQLMLSNTFLLLSNEYIKLEDHETLQDLISLCVFEKDLFELQATALNFCINNAAKLPYSEDFTFLIYNLIQESGSWVMVKVKALHFLSLIMREFKSFVVPNLELLLKLSNEPVYEVRMKALECLGCLVSQESDTRIKNFLTQCRSYYEENISFDARSSSINAVISYIKSTNKRDSNFGKAAFLLFDSMNDEDEEIRDIAGDCLSEVLDLKVTVKSTSVFKKFYQHIAGKLSDNVLQPLIVEEFNRYNVFSELIEFSENLKADSLLDYERPNLFKNQIDMVITANEMLVSSHKTLKLTQSYFDLAKAQILENADFVIKSIYANGDDGLVGWTRNEYYFVMFISTIISCETLLKIQEDEDLGAKYNLIRVLAAQFHISPIIRSYIH